MIDRLQRDGYTVAAPANPPRGMPTDTAHLARFLKSVEGPIVLVGHSYGGAVITNAAAGNVNIKALVYVAAFVPDKGEVLGELIQKYPGSEIQAALNPVPYDNADGTTGRGLYLRPDRIHDVFASDVPEKTSRIMEAGHRPFSATGFTDTAKIAAWRTIPSWGVVAAADKAIPSVLERFEYPGAHARGVVEVRGASHAVMVSHPGSVTNLIEDAARTTVKQDGRSRGTPFLLSESPGTGKAPDHKATWRHRREDSGMTDETTLPQYLRGRFAPVPEEHSAAGLTVRGSLPPDLDGHYLRNGPNPLPGEDKGHWFTGPGMLHGIRLRAGRAEWYRNRWVRTRELDGHPYRRADRTVDLAATSANTHVIRHAGTVLALCEAGLPYWVTPSLETMGPYDFEGRLTTAMTAHPKEDPATGELHLFGTAFTPPYLTYHRVTSDGRLLDSRPVDVPGPTMMHDFAVTEHHILWMDLPVVLDPALVGCGGLPYRWDDAYGARLGVMSRTPGASGVRWFTVDPCYVFHVGNAYEDARGRIVLDAVRYDRAGFQHAWTDIGGAGERASAPTSSVLHRWCLDPATGGVAETQLDDRAAEFPTHNETLTGRPNRYLYTVSDDGIAKHDLARRTGRVHETPGSRYAGEAVFVPAADGVGEDEGWLLSLVSRENGGAGELLVLDATDLTVQAVVELPRPVPAGFHGSWLPESGDVEQTPPVDGEVP
ncbi:alpha/beta fold hydrolase [Streptomyces sp. NPDC018352]|uniref:alpha/beta fold hydrolase n=1 Tax=Streptomyces sp. NPDC018352 TaxID=3157194 RepID=UPI0033CBB0CD